MVKSKERKPIIDIRRCLIFFLFDHSLGAKAEICQIFVGVLKNLRHQNFILKLSDLYLLLFYDFLLPMCHFCNHVSLMQLALLKENATMHEKVELTLKKSK